MYPVLLSGKWRFNAMKKTKELAKKSKQPNQVIDSGTDREPLLRKRGIERRRKMLDAALKLLQEKGFDEVSMNDVVREAGGSLSSAYKFFRNKEGLLIAVFEETMRRMGETIAKTELRGVSFSEKLGALIHGVFEARADAQAKIFIFNGLAIESFRRRSLATFENLLFPRFTEALERIAAETCVSFRIPAEDVALVLVRLLRGTLIEVILTSGTDKTRLEKAVRLITEAISSFTEVRDSKRNKRRSSASPSR